MSTSTYRLSLNGKPFCPFRDVVYTPRKMTLKEFWERYGKKLPVIIKVEEGYFGGLEFDVYSSGDVLWVVKVSCQKRVVAKDILREQYLSIPVDYDLRLQVLDKQVQPVGKPALLSEVLDKHKLPFSADVVHQKSFKYFVQADRDYQMQFETLRLIETYDERYFLAHTLLTGEICTSKACVIPMYLPIAVLAGEGVTRGDRSAWARLQATMAQAPRECNYHNHPMNTDLMIFNEDDVESSDGIYDYIEPKHYVKFDTKKGTLPPLLTKPRIPWETGQASASKPRTAITMNKRPPPPTPISKEQPGNQHHSKEFVFGACKPKESQQTKKPLSSARSKVTAAISPIVRSIQEKLTKHSVSSKVSSDKRETESSSDEEEYEKVNELQRKPETVFTKPPSHVAVVIPSQESRVSSKQEIRSAKVNDTELDNEDEIYASLKSVPGDLSKFSVSQIGDCLKMLNMEDYVEKFEEEKVDGALLLQLEPDDLQEAFGMSKMTSKKLCLFAKKRWRPTK